MYILEADKLDVYVLGIVLFFRFMHRKLMGHAHWSGVASSFSSRTDYVVAVAFINVRRHSEFDTTFRPL